MGHAQSIEAMPAGVGVSTQMTQVTLQVTPKLKPLDNMKLSHKLLTKRMQELGQEESTKGLIDAGGVFSFKEDAMVLDGTHPHGFIAAATTAFANHLPLAVRPQHFWLMIMQALATHVEQHAEEVRSKWVHHEGKKTLEVNCDEFGMHAANNWASVVDGKPDCFSAQIDKNIVPGLAEELTPGFSGTSADENIALKITVMDATKSFFSFKCSTCCGFPQVIMEGSLGDWQLLRQHAERLIKGRCEADFAKNWCDALLPVLDIFVSEYDNAASGAGKPNEKFWNSMCKRGGTSGSGARSWFNGWINIFFPYILKKPNRYMVPYREDNGYVKEGRDGGRYGMCAPADVQGPDCSDFPEGLAAAPVVWDYNGLELKLKFKAGFAAAQFDDDTKIVRPVVGWFIAHDGDDEREAKRARGPANYLR